MPSIGHGTDKRGKHVLQNGFRKVLINNVRELEVLMMMNQVYAAEVAHAVSAKKRGLLGIFLATAGSSLSQLLPLHATGLATGVRAVDGQIDVFLGVQSYDV